MWLTLMESPSKDYSPRAGRPLGCAPLAISADFPWPTVSFRVGGQAGPRLELTGSTKTCRLQPSVAEPNLTRH